LFKKYEFNSLLPNQDRKVEKVWNNLGLNVQIVGDSEWLENLKNKFKCIDKIVLDTETTSLDIIKAELVWISILLDDKNIYYINVEHKWPKVNKNDLKIFLKELLNSDITIIGHNIKYDLEIIELFINNTENENIWQSKVDNSFWQMTLGL
jgi:DNA polymerase I-like protein with 3'-5' exonuclease and polymerase domains